MPTSQHPLRSLPAKSSEEYLRKEAKRLSKLRRINLVAAQRALTREYGHRNWADLIAAAKAILQPAHPSSRLSTNHPESSDASHLGDDEWAAIRGVAEASLAEMPIAPNVKEWLDNRRSFHDSGGSQLQFVAILNKKVVGYACAEHPPAWLRRGEDSSGEYRLFVVVEPSARHTLGTRLLAKVGESLTSLGARRAWFQEYEADLGLISFLEEKGFVRANRFRAEDGTPIVRLSLDAPFDLLMTSAYRQSEHKPDGPAGEAPR